MTPAIAKTALAVLGIPDAQSTPRSTAGVFLVTVRDTTPVARVRYAVSTRQHSDPTRVMSESGASEAELGRCTPMSQRSSLPRVSPPLRPCNGCLPSRSPDPQAPAGGRDHAA